MNTSSIARAARPLVKTVCKHHQAKRNYVGVAYFNEATLPQTARFPYNLEELLVYNRVTTPSPKMIINEKPQTNAEAEVQEYTCVGVEFMEGNTETTKKPEQLTAYTQAPAVHPGNTCVGVMDSSTRQTPNAILAYTQGHAISGAAMPTFADNTTQKNTFVGINDIESSTTSKAPNCLLAYTQAPTKSHLPSSCVGIDYMTESTCPSTMSDEILAYTQGLVSVSETEQPTHQANFETESRCTCIGADYLKEESISRKIKSHMGNHILAYTQGHQTTSGTHQQNSCVGIDYCDADFEPHTFASSELLAYTQSTPVSKTTSSVEQFIRDIPAPEPKSSADFTEVISRVVAIRSPRKTPAMAI